MTGMDDRQKAFEAKYALDQELMFRIEARTAKLFGLWIAEKLGMADEEANAYAGTVVSANLSEAGFEDMKRAVRPVLAEKGIELSEDDINAHIERFMEEARLQITADKQ